MNEKNLNAPLRVVTVLWAVAVVLALVLSLTQDQQAPQEPTPAPQAEVTAPAETEPVVVGDAEEAGVMYYDRLDVEVLAKVLYREARGIPSDTEKACVGWVVCNRVDAGYADTPSQVMTSPSQFAYIEDTPVLPELCALAGDVLERWSREKNGEDDVGRVLPKEYLWFSGDGSHNHFRNQYSGGSRWDYSLPSPYES